MQLKIEQMERQLKHSDSLLAVYAYEVKFYLEAIDGYSKQLIQK